MMTLRIAAHEFRYMFFSVQTLVAFLALFGFATMFTADGSEFQLTAGGGNVLINAPTMITFFLLMASVVATFFVPSYMATAVLKDADSKFDAILFSTSMSKNNYLLGRFFGAFAALMLVMAAGPLGMLLGTFWPWAMPETLAPTNISHYLIAWFGFLLPTMLLVSALVFAVAVIWRSMMHCYITVLGLFILYVAGLGSSTISPLWDPFMLGTFNDQVDYWTAAELNKNMISYTGTVLANRMIWLGVAAAFMGIAYLRFSPQTPAKLAKEPSVDLKSNDAEIRARANIGYRGTPNWASGTHFRQFLFCTKNEAMTVLKSQPFLLLMGLSLFLLVTALTNREVLYGVNALPVTRIMLENTVDALVWALLAITTFYGADIVWRDRESKFNELLDATPAPNWVFVVSKIAALCAVVYSVLILGVIVALGIQVLNGYSTFEFGLYLERSLLFSTMFIFLAVLACFLQVLVKNRFLGIMLMGLYWIVTLGSIGALGLEHPLLRYAMGMMSSPLSDMNGDGRFMEAALWARVYNASVAGLLVMMTYVLWNRGTLQPLKYRLKRLKAFKTARFAVPFAVLIALFIGSGSFIFYNTNMVNEYRTRSDVLELKVAYETKFRQYESLPMPRTVDIKMDVDIYPYKGRVETRATHILQNKTDVDIDVVHLVFSSLLADVPHVVLEGASITSVDELYHYYILDLETPMAPGEKRTLEFETLIHNQGFRHQGNDITLVRNGTFIDNRRIAPHIGFNPDFMVSDRNQRRDAGLPVLPRMAALEDADQFGTNGHRADSDFVRYEATVSTTPDQIAVTPGYLQNEWLDGDRRYFSYKMDAPIMNLINFLSAEYEVVRDKWNGVDIEIFHHKPHTYNLDRMMESSKDSLAYFTQAFGPYQFRQVRILEFPAYRMVAKSFPNTIAYSADLGFLADIADNTVIDVPYYVTAHEIAHQWWAHQIVPANVQGAAMLSETLSQYSALMVMEKRYGKDNVRQFLKYELDSYLSGRNGEADAEVPLMRAEGQEYIHYRKGAVIMYALKDYLGEDVVNRALRRLVEAYAFKTSPYPTTTNLLAYLKEEAGPEHHGLIEDFLEKITLYDVRLTGSRVEEMPDGRFRVMLDIEASKFYSDGIGNQRQTTFDIPVDIGLFLNSPAGKGFGSADVVMLEKRKVSDGSSTIELIVNQKPAFAGIDPYNKLIDRDSDDNLVVIESSVN